MYSMRRRWKSGALGFSEGSAWMNSVRFCGVGKAVSCFLSR